MANSIVKAPKNTGIDYDYIAFSFNGLHSCEDMGIIRTSDGDRYNEELMPTSQDTTTEVVGSDGMYYFNTRHKQKVFSISFAFQELDDMGIRNLKNWLNTKEMGDLWFAENPYKVYTAKVTGTPQIKVIPFDVYSTDKKKTIRVYRGEGSVQFTCYWPYAHTPDYVQNLKGELGNGKVLSSYADFSNKDQWADASGLTNSTGACAGENPGDVPAHFTVTISSSVASGTTLQVGEAKIVTTSTNSNLTWDSKTGMVSTKSSNLDKAIDFTGKSCGTIPAGVASINKQLPSGAKLQYHYWYY